MKQLNLNNMGLELISLQDAEMIDGGTYSSGYAAGNSAGKIVQSALKEWGILSTLKSIAEGLEWL